MTSSDQPGPLSEPPEPLDVVETPTSPSSGLALSRFEFETGKANDGTKVLMVEWDSSAWDKGQQRYADRDGKQGDEWDVSWEGKEKTKVLMVRDADVETESSTRRVYFLLPPGASIPTLVTIRRQDKGSCRSNDNDDVVLRTKPMPAIFPAELTGYQAAGRRGVLHTIWAKKRLVDLKAEIEAEARVNGESVGLEMALQEQRWIIDNFGLDPDPDTGLPQPTRLYIPQTSVTVSSPRSPVGGRLGEKLKGLKLATSPTELAAASQGKLHQALSHREGTCRALLWVYIPKPSCGQPEE